jgi:UPF0716 protein FxsA
VPLLLIAAFIVIPLLELYVIIQVGGSIGAGPTIFLLLLDSVVGAVLLRSQGRAAWVRFNRAMAENRVPAKEVLDGVLIIFGGALLLTPGFLTDIVGLILLIPPTRAIVRGIGKGFVMRRMGPRAAGWGYQQVRSRGAGRRGPESEPAAQARRRHSPKPEDFDWESPRPGPQPGDIDGTAHEVGDGEDSLPPGERGSFQG